MADVTARSLQYEYKAVRGGLRRTRALSPVGSRRLGKTVSAWRPRRTTKAGGSLSAVPAPSQMSPPTCPALPQGWDRGSVRSHIALLICSPFDHALLYDALSSGKHLFILTSDHQCLVALIFTSFVIIRWCPWNWLCLRQSFDNIVICFRTRILSSKLTALSLTGPAGMNPQERCYPWLGSWRAPGWEIRPNGPNHRCRRKEEPSEYPGENDFSSNAKTIFLWAIEQHFCWNAGYRMRHQWH